MSIALEQKNNKPTFEQLADFLPSKLKDNMYDLIESCKKLKMIPRWYATNSFNIKYKGKMVFRFRIFEDGVVHLYFTVAKRVDLDSLLTDLPKDMQEFYFTNIRRCLHCNPAHGDGQKIQILNNNYWICAEPEICIYNPSKEQIEYLTKFITIRREYINGMV